MPFAYTSDDQYRLGIAAAFAVVAEQFTHIAVEDIMRPPSRRFFDAYFARQVAYHIAINVLMVPRKRLMVLETQCRPVIRAAMTTVNMRLDDPLFRDCYDRMADRALNMVTEQLEEAA